VNRDDARKMREALARLDEISREAAQIRETLSNLAERAGLAPEERHSSLPSARVVAADTRSMERRESEQLIVPDSTSGEPT
jgi:hypothetical protein